MKAEAETVEEGFMAFLTVFRRYPAVFPEGKTNAEYRQMYEKSYNFICTRAFGWSLPSTSLIPLADSLNHNNDYVTHMLVDTKLELEPNEQYKVRRNKYNLSLLSQVRPELSGGQVPRRAKRRADKFVEKHKEILEGGKKKDPQACILW
jgi:hypothetical protein